MNLTVVALWQTTLALVCFLSLMVPTGFLLGWALDFLRFRTRSAVEQLVWSVALSLPFNLLLFNGVGLLLPDAATLSLLLACDAAALALGVHLWRAGRLHSPRLDSHARLALWIVAAMVAYIILAGIPFEFHHKIYEPVFATDWEIRLPLIRFAETSRIPPPNPFFTFRGRSEPLQYYFYWTVLCARIAWFTHLGARPVFLGSSAYALATILAALFLYLRHVLTGRGASKTRYVALLGLMFVVGLDLIPSLLGLWLYRARLHPEMEWWSLDRSPNLLGTVLYAPHHVAGLACGLVGLLGLMACTEKELRNTRDWWAGALLGGLCLGALSGTSTFMLLFFALAGAGLFTEALWHRNGKGALGVCMAGLLCGALTLPLLHTLHAAAAGTAHPATTAGPHIHFGVRHYYNAVMQLGHLDRIFHLHLALGKVRFPLRVAAVVLLFCAELGFFAVPIGLQLHQDWHAPEPLSHRQRGLWILFASAAFFFVFLSTRVGIGPNDLGLHAGILVRTVAMLWGALLLAKYRDTRRSGGTWTLPPWLLTLSAVLLLLGVGGWLWDATVERTYTALLNRRVVPPAYPFLFTPDIGQASEDIYTANRRVDAALPREAVTQMDPYESYATFFRLYQTRRQAAGDISCEISFGGDPAICKSFMPLLLTLYDEPLVVEGGQPKRPEMESASVSLMRFTTVCNQVGIDALFVTDLDPVWQNSNSWVWHAPLLYRNKTLRLLQCPETWRHAHS